jgi:hypothetical protein
MLKDQVDSDAVKERSSVSQGDFAEI